MNDKNNQQPRSWQSGFLLLGAVWGIAIGYVIADAWASEGNGRLLFHGTFPSQRNLATACLLIPPALGFFVGFLLDYLIVKPTIRSRWIDVGFILLAYSATAYVILVYVFPSVQSVRE